MSQTMTKRRARMTDTRNASAALMLGLLVAGLLFQDADAQDPNSANYYVPACQQILADPPRLGFKVGLCAGLIEGLGYTAGLLPDPFKSCAPKGVTNLQSARVVLAYIEHRPQRMHEDFRKLVLDALRDAWPCR